MHLGVEVDFVPARKAHPAFVVTGLDQMRAHLLSLGIEIVEDEVLDGYVRVYVYDPFGNRLELMESVQG